MYEPANRYYLGTTVRRRGPSLVVLHNNKRKQDGIDNGSRRPTSTNRLTKPDHIVAGFDQSNWCLAFVFAFAFRHFGHVAMCHDYMEQ